MSLTSPIDDVPYRLNAEFRKKGVVVHRRSGSSWWERLLRVEEQWAWIRNIGSGSFGVVYLEEESATKKLRAVKRIAMPPVGSEGDWGLINTRRELQILVDLREYENLFVQFLGWYQNSEKDFIYLAMEYVEHGDLGKYLKYFGAQTETNARIIAEQILEGLAMLHRRHICHRDLKPENVLVASISPIHVKLADFGVSKCENGTKLKTRLGTLAYQAPELLGLVPQTSPDSRRTDYTNAVDMWAFGCLLYQILTTETPFVTKPRDAYSLSNPSALASQHDMDLFYAYCSGKVELPVQSLQSRVTNLGVDLVTRLLSPDPNSRISSADALDHGWMSGFPSIPNHRKGPVAIWRQLESLGVKISLDTTELLIHECGEKHHAADSTPVFSSIVTKFPRLLEVAESKGYIPILEMLLGFRPWPLGPCGDGINSMTGRVPDRTALQAAAECGRFEVVNFLIEKGADINTAPAKWRGTTALQAAAGGGHLEIVKFLIEKGADVNAEPAIQSGRTALQAAAERGHFEVVKFLIKKGADVNAGPAFLSHFEVVKFLIEKRADVNAEPAIHSGRTALQAAAERGHFEVVKFLIKKGADVNAEPILQSGRTALQAAAECGHFEVLKFLIEKGADINAGPTEWSGRTTLQAAAGGGHLEIVNFLIKKGADVNAEPAFQSGRTALQAAAGDGHFETVKFLIEKGANVNAKPIFVSGRTALQAAAERGHFEVVKFLIEKGADVNAAPALDSGITALQAAAECGRSEVVRFLIEKGADVKGGGNEPVR